MKDIPWYEWRYAITEDWRVWSYNWWLRKWKYLNSYNAGKWYIQITLKKWPTKKFFIHRLMWIVFIENPDNKPCINHKNWIRHDNRIENLEWVTHSENTIHGFRVNGRKHSKKHAESVRMSARVRLLKS